MKTHHVVVYGIFLAILSMSIASAQVATGTPALGSFGGGPFDTVNLGNLNVHFAIPVLHKAGRGMPFTYDLSYDSSIWTPVGASGTAQWQPASNFGWRGVTEVSTGYMSETTTSTICSYTNTRPPVPNGWYVVISNVVYHDSWGVAHPFVGSTWTKSSTCSGGGSGGQIGPLAADASGYQYVGLGKVADRTGRQKTVPVNGGSGAGTTLDSNGNEITANTSGQFFDTLSATIPVLTVSTAAPPTSTTFTYAAPADGASSCNPISQCASVTMNYQKYTVQTGFGVSGVKEYGPLSNPLVSSIQMPDGSSYTFSYENGPSSCTPISGTVGCTTGRILEITLPTGGSIKYTYSGGNNGIESDGSTAGLTRTLNPGGEWQYSRTQQGSIAPGPGSAWITTVIDPSNNYTTINFAEDATTDSSTTVATYNLYETQRQVYQGSVSPSNLLATGIHCYNLNYATCSSATVKSPISQTDSYTQLPNGKTRLSEILFNAYGLVTEDKEYDYGVALGNAPSSTYLIANSSTTYYAPSNSIASMVESVITRDGNGNTKAAVTYTFDGTTVTQTTGTPQHLGVGSVRGNLTTIATQAGSIILYRQFTYYDTGMLNNSTSADSSSATTCSSKSSICTTYNYSNATATCGNAFPTSISEPMSLSRSMTWNCIGGMLLTLKDESGNTTTTDYSTDPHFWRPDFTLDQLQNKTTLSYPNATAMEGTLSFNAQSSVSDIRITLDGFGRPTLNQQEQGPSLNEYDTAETDYNNLGQVSRSTMPFQAAAGGTNSTAPGVTASYDALSRPQLITDGGGGTVQYAYTNNDVLLVTGPTQNFQKQLEYDGLGRLTSVCEISTTLPGVAPCGQTTSATGYWTRYQYDTQGDLVGVCQNTTVSTGTDCVKNPSANQQTRTYTYDMLGRLTSEVNPESGTTTYAYDVPTSICTNSAWNAYMPGALVQAQDANGNVTCYYRDALQRVRAIDVEAGPNQWKTCTAYGYDSSVGLWGQGPPAGATLSNIAGRLVEAETDNCNGNVSGIITDEWFNYDADGNLTDIYQSTPHAGGYYHSRVSYWPNGAPNTLGLSLLSSGTALIPTQTYGVDGEGRPNSISAAGTNPVTSVTYATSGTSQPIGALTGLTLGTGDNDTFSYDANTGRQMQYAFTTGATPQTLTGSLGWNANGSLKLHAIIDPFNTSNSQTCGYSYDDLARVSSVGCGGESDLTNPGFEAGNTGWTLGSGYTIVNNASNAQAGSWYLSGSSTGDVWASAKNGSGSGWSSVTPGSVLEYGGWINRVAGTGNLWYSCEVVDSNYNLVAWCPPAGLSDGSSGAGWNFYENNYTVPTNGAYVQFYAEIHGGGDTDTSLTTGYFDTVTFASSASLWSQGFTYDPFGNVSKSGSASWLPLYNSPANDNLAVNNQYKSGWNGISYDSNGDLLNDTFHTYTWDGYGQVSSLDGQAIVFDALGHQVEYANGQYQFVYAPGVTAHIAVMGGQTLEYAQVPLVGGVQALYNSSGLYLYAHPDWLGSIRTYTTTSRTVVTDNAYAPFGENYDSIGSHTGIEFTGVNADTASGLYDFMFRKYSANQGRWISPDPEGLAAVDPTNPQSWNRYAYVENMPLNSTDPLGLYCPVIPAWEPFVNWGAIASQIACSNPGDDVWFYGTGSGGYTGGNGFCGNCAPPSYGAGGGFGFSINMGGGPCSDFMPCGLQYPSLGQSIWSDVLGLPSGLNCPQMGGVSNYFCGGINPIMDASSTFEDCLSQAESQFVSDYNQFDAGARANWWLTKHGNWVRDGIYAGASGVGTGVVMGLRGATLGSSLLGGGEAFAISLGAIALVDITHDAIISGIAEQRAQNLWHQRIANCQSQFNMR